MFQVRFHGRGGQGVVTAADILAKAAFLGDKYAQAIPNFGSERTGAPVVSYCRVSDQPIRTREPVNAPDALVIQDSTLLHQVNLLAGFQPDGYIVINTQHSFSELGLDEFAATHDRSRLVTVPATALAMEYVGKPIVNAALLGGLVALTGVVEIEHVTAAIESRFPTHLAQPNAAAATAVFEKVRDAQGAKSSA